MDTDFLGGITVEVELAVVTANKLAHRRSGREGGSLPRDNVNIFITDAIRDIRSVFDHARQAKRNVSPP